MHGLQIYPDGGASDEGSETLPVTAHTTKTACPTQIPFFRDPADAGCIFIPYEQLSFADSIKRSYLLLPQNVSCHTR